MKPIRFAYPEFYPEDINFYGEITDGQLVAGERVQYLEKTLGAMFGVPYVLGTVSGTVALDLAISVLTQPDDIILMPAYCYVSLYYAAVKNFCDVWFVDCKKNFPIIDNSQVYTAMERAKWEYGANRRRRIWLIAAGFAGVNVQLQLPIPGIAGVIYDNSHCISNSAYAKNEQTAAVCFSFGPTKEITGGANAGAVCFFDRKAYEDAKCLSENGKRGGDFVMVGCRGRMGEIGAGILLAQIERLTTIQSQRSVAAGLYCGGLPDNLFGYSAGLLLQKSSWSLFPIFIPEAKRKMLELIFAKEHIGFSRHYVPIPAWDVCSEHKQAEQVEETLPNTYWLSRREISLPMHTRLTGTEIARVIKTVWRVL